MIFWTESLTCSCIDSCRILLESYVLAASLLHVSRTSYELLYIETCYCDRQQTYWGQNREAATYIIRDDEALVTFLVSTSTCCTLLGVGYSYDNILSLFFTALILALLL